MFPGAVARLGKPCEKAGLRAGTQAVFRCAVQANLPAEEVERIRLWGGWVRRSGTLPPPTKRPPVRRTCPLAREVVAELDRRWAKVLEESRRHPLGLDHLDGLGRLHRWSLDRVPLELEVPELVELFKRTGVAPW
jgi:hypothetical protein